MFSFGSIPIEIPKEKLGLPLASSQKAETIFRQYKIGPIKNQKDEPKCVGFALSNLFLAEPIIQNVDPDKIYDGARKFGKTPKSIDGAKLTSAVDFLKNENLIREDFWSNNAEECVNYLFSVSPLVLSIPWSTKMNDPEKSGKIKLGGSYIGHHAVMAYSYDRLKKNMNLVNQWGSGWGRNGTFSLSFADFDKLLKNGGIAVAILE